ncbi:hypothetical protein [Dinghuibacter silviterrae]|uniref:hypothetical protein n=1 Tax=Dinghuibacter silviterrae TaxID=1539049 RepID=UPI0013C2D6DF|nr:hypothetical protein [Dinghuibacter silviterrae]
MILVLMVRKGQNKEKCGPAAANSGKTYIAALNTAVHGVEADRAKAEPIEPFYIYCHAAGHRPGDAYP